MKILVADDSALMRAFLKDMLKSAPFISEIVTATNGKDALEQTLRSKPDVILMDLNMGEYDGLYGVTTIMKQQPTPIIILSAVGNTDMNPILEAMKQGAVDYQLKPVKSSNIESVRDDLLVKVKQAYDANLVKYKDNGRMTLPHTFDGELNYDVVVIGSSTGGPPAIENILSKLPENFALPVIIAQHMPAGFVPSFAQRLDALCPLKVSMAKKGDAVVAGNVLIAPGSRNMIVKKNPGGTIEIDFTSRTFKEFNYPSVNSLMLSVAEVYGARALGVILTGMGKDGTEGLKSIYNAGGYTVAQSKETCVVYGMPKEAVDSGCVKSIVPINEISMFLVSCIS